MVLNNETVTITQDTTTEVKQGNRKVTVDQGNDEHTVTQGYRKVTVSQGDDTHTVSTGKRTVTVSTGDDEHTVSTGNRSVTVSTGNDTHTISTGNRSVTVSLGNDSTTVSVGNHTLSVSAGSSTISVGQSLTVSANLGITLSCGPCSIALSPSGITISGPMISASADATMTLNGGGEMTLQAGMIMIN